MNIIRTCLAGAAIAVAAACSGSQPLATPQKGARFDGATPPAVGAPSTTIQFPSGPQMGMCADSTMQLMPDGCTGRGGMLGSGT